MIDGRKTVFEKVLGQCNDAFLAKMPILYLLTDEMELVDAVVEAQTMVELLAFLPNNDAGSQFVPYDEYIRREGLKGESCPPENYRLGDDCFPFPFTISGKKTCPEIGVVKNFNLYDESAPRALLRYVEKYVRAPAASSVRNSVLLLTGPVLRIPAGLEPYVEVIDVPPLEDFEIRAALRAFAQTRRETLTEAYVARLAESLRGFSKSKIDIVLKKIVAEAEYLAGGAHTAGRRIEEQPENVALRIIRGEKEQMLKKNGALSLVEPEQVSVGGLQGLNDWLRKSRVILENLPEAKNGWNLGFPKGILISGIPGSGKSLMAKRTAQIFGTPLVKLDMGALMGGHVGESEGNMRAALRMAEAMAPCVLWVDELEKGFAGVSGSGDGDSGTLKRMFASFLTWMQENQSACFIFATANDIRRLPPEFLRRGRFDQKFYVFMPMRRECIEIFQAILHKMNATKSRRPLFESGVTDERFLGELVDFCVTDGREKLLTGADIEGLVGDAVKAVFFRKVGGRDDTPFRISASEFRDALKEAVLTTQTYGETNLREIADCFIGLCEHKFKPASGGDAGRVLFRFDAFRPDRDPAIEQTCPYTSKYDAALYAILQGEINKRMRENNQYKKSQNI